MTKEELNILNSIDTIKIINKSWGIYKKILKNADYKGAKSSVIIDYDSKNNIISKQFISREQFEYLLIDKKKINEIDETTCLIDLIGKNLHEMVFDVSTIKISGKNKYYCEYTGTKFGKTFRKKLQYITKLENSPSNQVFIKENVEFINSFISKNEKEINNGNFDEILNLISNQCKNFNYYQRVMIEGVFASSINRYFSSIKFIPDHFYLGYIDTGTATEINITDNITEIGDYAFANLSNIKSIINLEKVKKIGINAFINSPNLIVSSRNKLVIDYCIKYNIKYKKI